MKVLYASDADSIHDQRFLEKFVEAGYKTHVVTFSKNPIRVRGITYHNLPLEIRGYSPKSALRMARGYFFLKKVLQKVKPDVLHGGWVQKYGYLCALANYHPFILMPWGSDILIDPKKSSLIKSITKFTIKNADWITCDAEYVKNKIIEMTGYPSGKITVFPWGIDLKKFNPGARSDVRSKLGWKDKRILVMTRPFKPIYGIEYFLQALPEVIKKNPDVRVILCGDGPLKSKFEEYVKKHEMKRHVHFAGFVENDELPKYYNAADIYVSTSLSDGTSLCLLEALACGLPVVVSDLPTNREWVTNGVGGLLIPKKNSRRTANEINSLLKDRRAREKMGKNNLGVARRRANWDKNFRVLEKIFWAMTKK